MSERQTSLPSTAIISTSGGPNSYSMDFETAENEVDPNELVPSAALLHHINSGYALSEWPVTRNTAGFDIILKTFPVPPSGNFWRNEK